MGWTVIGEDIDETPLGAYQIWTLLIGGGIIFAEGYEMQMLASVSDAVAKDLGIAEIEKSALMSLVFVGFLIGNFSGGLAADAFGRRSPVLWSYAGMLVFSIGSAIATNFSLVCLMRAGLGFAQGFGHPAIIAHFGEVVQSQYRPIMFCGISMWFGVGTVVAAGIAHFDDPSYRNLHWRFLMGSNAVPCFIFGAVWYFYGDESPYFLSAQNQEGDAEAVLKQMGSNAKRQASKIRLLPFREAIREIFITEFGITSVLGIATFSGDFVSFGMSYAVPQIGRRITLQTLEIGSLIAFGNTVALFGNVILVLVGDRIMRSTLGMITFYGIGLGIALLTCGVLWKSNEVEATSTELRAAELSIAFGFVIMMIFINATYCVLSLVAVELYRTELRATAKGSLMTIGRVAGILAPPLCELTRAGAREAIAQVFCEVTLALSLFAGTVLFFLRRDPRGKPLDSTPRIGHSETTGLLA